MSIRKLHLLVRRLWRHARTALTRVVESPRPKWHSLGDEIVNKAAPTLTNAAAGDGVGIVHAVLTPEGLVLVNGVVEGAVWCGDGDSPRRGEVVSVSYDAIQNIWQALPPATRQTPAATGTETADES
jgi:hypothetical protein